VTSQRAHTKYKWPPYANEWNTTHENFLCTPLAVCMFISNSMQLCWTIDNIPLPLVSRMLWLKLCNGDPSGKRKCKVTSIKPIWQANRSYSAITSLLLNGNFVRRTIDLEKTAKAADRSTTKSENSPNGKITPAVLLPLMPNRHFLVKIFNAKRLCLFYLMRQKHCWNYFAFNQSYLANGKMAPVVLLPHEAKYKYMILHWRIRTASD